MASIIQIRRDTASNWTSANPILAQGEMGVETDTSKIKIGDGTTAWASLGYLIDTGGYASYGDTTANFTGTLQNSGSNVLVDTDIGVSVQAYDANTTKNNVSNTFTGAQIGTVTALTYAATISIDLATNNNFSYLTVTGNTTLGLPSNPVAGQSGVITITQGATARTMAYNTFWKFAGGTVPTLTATAGAVDVLVYSVESATRATCQLIKDVK